MLPEHIQKAIQDALESVETDIKARIKNNEGFGDLDLIKSELIEMKQEKRKQSSDGLSYIIVDSMDWDQPCLKKFNIVCAALRKHFRLRP